jgi:hypothetical protein
MTEDKKIITPNADVKHLKKNAHTGTYSWDGGE